MTAADAEADRRLIRTAVIAAGRLAIEHFRARRGHWYKGPGQVVTETDFAVDRLLHERLCGARPDYGWLSEERPDDGSRLRRRRVWMVDPIDGTRAFAEGVPEFAISVALIEDGEPQIGVVFNPATGEYFEAMRGAGASVDGAPMRASDRTELAGARLLSSRTEIRRRNWRALFPEAEITTMGSLAYKLAVLAAGRSDGLVSLRRSHDWDLAAAVLLLTEAGGYITDAKAKPLALNRHDLRHAGLIAAGTPELHAALQARLATLTN